MGVTGLTSFLKRNEVQADILLEIRSWIRENPNRSPLVVLDLTSFTHYALELSDSVCGGRHEILLEIYENFFEKLKSTEATLVFFVNLQVTEEKAEEWLAKEEEKFKYFVELYDRIRNGEALQNIVANEDSKCFGTKLTTEELLLQYVAQKYGEIRYAVERRLHLEMAKFATENNAFAVVDNDTDFYIYEGKWKFWSFDKLVLNQYKDQGGNIIATEHNRNALTSRLKISVHHRPLWATLMGNKIIGHGQYWSVLSKFADRLGPRNRRCQLIAQYVTRIHGKNERLTNIDIERIARDVFDNDDDQEWAKLIRNSIASYDLNYQKGTEDPLTERLLLGNSYFYRVYKSTMENVHAFSSSYYDMRGNIGEESLSILFIKWLKRKVGILRLQQEDKSFTILVLAKFSFDEECRQSNEKPIFPDFEVPALEDLYFNENILDMNWKLMGWIMSLSDNVLEAIGTAIREYRLISTTLFAMVKEGFCTVEQADGILITEHTVRTNKEVVRQARYPETLSECNIRVAHIYNLMFLQVNDNFSVAGLLSIIEIVPRFDGVYFQHIMTLSVEERRNMLSSCSNHRIYHL